MYAVYKLEHHNSQLMHQINEIYISEMLGYCVRHRCIPLQSPYCKVGTSGVCVSAQRIPAPHGTPHMCGSPRVCAQLLGPTMPTLGPSKLNHIITVPLTPGPE